jgi:hypothetical protein
MLAFKKGITKTTTTKKQGDLVMETLHTCSRAKEGRAIGVHHGEC